MLATTFVALAGLAACAAQVRAVEPVELAPNVVASAQVPIVTSVRERMPRGLRSRIDAATPGAVDHGWVDLPDTLDGRVRLASRSNATPGNAGWEMLDVPAIPRTDLDGGAVYASGEWDVLQLAERDRLREFIVVNAHQGTKTWRWRLHGADAKVAPKLREV